MSFISLRWQDIPDILIVALIIYQILLLFVGTRAMQLLRGIMTIGLLGILANVLEFRTLSWIIGKVLGAFIIIIPILFQPELRRILEEIGKSRLLSASEQKTWNRKAEQLKNALLYCKERKIGVLCVLQRATALKDIWSTAVPLGAEITEELLISIFWQGTPLHDGAVVLNREKIIAAGCYLPLTDKPELSRWYGTRHRAAIGVTETSDAMALVVSEERGEITAAIAGKLSGALNEKQVEQICSHYFADGGETESFMERLRNEIKLKWAEESEDGK